MLIYIVRQASTCLHPFDPGASFCDSYCLMMKPTALLTLSTLLFCINAGAGEITGTITLKGTPPKEKDITPLKDDPNCGKLHSSMPTTHFYVVGSKGELADVVVSVQGDRKS